MLDMNLELMKLSLALYTEGQKEKASYIAGIVCQNIMIEVICPTISKQ